MYTYTLKWLSWTFFSLTIAFEFQIGESNLTYYVIRPRRFYTTEIMPVCDAVCYC